MQENGNKKEPQVFNVSICTMQYAAEVLQLLVSLAAKYSINTIYVSLLKTLGN